MTLTPNEALIQKLQAMPQDTAFIFHGAVWTYQKLANEVDRLARAMAANGVGPGDRVAIHMMNRPEFVVAYYACFRLGAIATPLPTALTFSELAPILRRLQPVLYLGEAGLYGNVAAVDGVLLPASQRFVLGGKAGDAGLQPWDALFDGSQDAVMFPPVADEPCVLITTSGTTGQPKFVVHTQATLAASVALMHRHWNISGRDTMVMPLALAHMTGLFFTVGCVQLGVGFVLMEGFEAEQVIDAMEHYRATIHIGFPAQYAALRDAQTTRRRDLGTLRYALSGGDNCPIALQEQVTSQFGAPLYNVWGASEVLGLLTFGLRPGPVTRITAGAEIRLVDEQGKDVADGEVGELLLRGDNVFIGYWDDETATAAALRDGWYHTGDLMRRAEADELWFVARKKDVIIRGGLNISPAEIEDAIVAAHPAVEQAAVVGLPDEVLGQRVFAFTTLSDTAADHTVISDLVARLAQRLAACKMPEAIMLLDKMPRSAASKVDRQMLLAMAMQADRDRSSQTTPARLPTSQAPARRRVASR